MVVKMKMNPHVHAAASPCLAMLPEIIHMSCSGMSSASYLCVSALLTLFR